jgi:hypothetical protein
LSYGVVEWPEMPLTSTELPFTTPQATEDELQRNPRWTPTFVSPMATSNSAYYFGHATREAALVLLHYGIWPAARALWSRDGGQIAPDTNGPEDLRGLTARSSRAILNRCHYRRWPPRHTSWEG